MKMMKFLQNSIDKSYKTTYTKSKCKIGVAEQSRSKRDKKPQHFSV